MTRDLSLFAAGVRRRADDKVTYVLKNGTIPVGLLHREHCWTLELYELAAVDRSVYRPRRRRVLGRTAILTYLHEHDAGQRLSGITERLMLRHAQRECAFDAVNGGWLARRAGSSAGSARTDEKLLPDSAKVR